MSTRTVDQLGLALELHRALAGSAEYNACCSPLSIAAALGITSEATAGRTRAELLELLGEPERLRAELATAASAEKAELAVVNTVWTAEHIEAGAQFRERLAAWPETALRPAPFRTEPERARELINTDVERTTRGLIPELVPAGAVGMDTVATIVNALYLRASWSKPFSEHGSERFNGAGTVAMMSLTEPLRYAETEGWCSVTLSAGEDIEASVLLPDGELANAEPELSAATMAELLDSGRTRPIRLLLPRFRVRASVSMRAALAGLGVREMFGELADFSPMTASQVQVSEVLHEAVLRVDEHGFEGAAATAVLVRLAAMTTPDPLLVRVDRPFLFVVRDRRSGVVYFMARVAEPGHEVGERSE